jgi:hypothetical protein
VIPALGLIAVGLILNTVSVIGQSGTDSDVATYITSGGNVAAVGGLVYVAKKIFSGDLVSRPTSVVERELVALVNASHSREEALQSCMTSSHDREKRNDQLTEKLIETIHDVRQSRG